MWHVLQNGLLDVAVPWKKGDFVDSCALNAKNAIRDLGVALDQGLIDEDGSFLLDLAMLNHVLIKKQLVDCNRCLLCRRRGVKLKSSHTVPKFLLKELNTQTSNRLKELGLEIGGWELFHNTSGKFRADTANTAMVYTLLCERCEQILSQNGEDQFHKEILPHIYTESDDVEIVNYNDTLYSFCLGVLFRSFANNTFVHFVNADEIYSLFVTCRQHLIHLPAKISEKNKISHPPSVKGLGQMTAPKVYLIINPYKVHVANFNLIPLAAFVSSGATSSFLNHSLNKEPTTKLCHAVVVHMGTINVIVPFSPAQNALLDEAHCIDPQGGVYPILPEISRWKATPPGVFQSICDVAVSFWKQYQQMISGMKTTKGDSRKADSLVEMIEQSSNLLQTGPIDISTLKSMPIPSEEIELISMFVSKSPLRVQLLPEGMYITFNPPKLTLTKEYTLLCHIYDKDQSETFFIAGTSAQISEGKLIVIMTATEEMDTFERVEGVCLHIKGDGSLCVTGHIQEPTTETLRQSQYSRTGGVTDKVMKAMNMLVQRCGSPNAFLHHALIQTRFQNRVSLDHKCFDIGCWYCQDCCHICMEHANQGYTLFPSKGMMFKHCGEYCKSIVDNHSLFSLKILPVCPSSHDKKNLILLSTEGCYSSPLSKYTIVQITICVAVDMASVNYGKTFALVQLRTPEQHFFFSAYLADDFSPTTPIHEFPPGFSFALLVDSGIILQVLEMSLQHTDISSISCLLVKAMAVDKTLAKHFITLCPPKKLLDEDILRKKIYDEDSFTEWMVEQIVPSNGKLENGQQFQSLHSSRLLLLSTTSTLSCIFWCYLQFTCILWKQFLTDQLNTTELLLKKLSHAVHVLTMVYEQCPQDLQNLLIEKFCLRQDILLLCGKIAIAAVKGEIFAKEVIQFITLINKFTLLPACTATAMRSFVVNHLCFELEAVKQTNQQSNSGVPIAQHFLLSLLLKALCNITAVSNISEESLSTLIGYVQPLLHSPFMLNTVLAKAVAVHLRNYSPVTESDVELTDDEISIIVVTLLNISHDKLKQRYYSNIMLQVLNLLCSHSMNLVKFKSSGVMDVLQSLLEVGGEGEDLVASILWKIASNNEVTSDISDEVVSEYNCTQGDLAEIESEVNFSLRIYQGLQCIIDKLFVIIKQCNELYFGCKQVPQAQAHTVYTAVQLLLELHQAMDTEELQEVANSAAKGVILNLLGTLICDRKPAIPNWDCTRTVIETLILIWIEHSKEFCQAMIGTGTLKHLAADFNWALSHESNDIESLQNQVGIIFKCARMFPMQVAFQLEPINFRPLLQCSSITVRVLIKSVLAFMSTHREMSNIVQHFTLLEEEVTFIAKSLTDMLHCGTSKIGCIFSNAEEILYLLRSLTCCPCDKSCCAIPILLDTLTSTCLSFDKNIANVAMEVLWNLSFDPLVSFAILNHEAAVYSLQSLTFTSGCMHISENILWTLGCRTVRSISGCYDYALACYNSGKYDEAVLWCDHMLENISACNPLALDLKSCKGKSLAQKYLHRQIQHFFKNDDWALLGYDHNASMFQSTTDTLLNVSHSTKEYLRNLCLTDVRNWEDLCSEGLQAIDLLGEVLDSNLLDSEGSELLDFLLVDYSKEAGASSKCKRCILCRVVCDLVPGSLQSVAPSEVELEGASHLSSSDQNTFILRSYTYTDGSQTTFMFCHECDSLLSYHCKSYMHFILEAVDPIKEKPFGYDNSLFTFLIGYIAKSLPFILSHCISNKKAVYDAFLTCREILLSPDKGVGQGMGQMSLLKMHFLVNPYSWYKFKKSTHCLYKVSSLSRNINAVITSQQDICECVYFLFHTGAWNIVLDFSSGSEISPEYLVHPSGGSYPIPSLRQSWEVLPFYILKVFNDLALADSHRGIFKLLLSSDGRVLPHESNLPLSTTSVKFLLPCQRIISLLPKQFYVTVDAENNVNSISVPHDHTILGHSYDREKDVTFILACASDVASKEKQFYFISIHKVMGCCIIEAEFLKGEFSMPTPTSSPILFPMTPSLGCKEVHLIRQLLRQRFDIVLFVRFLASVLAKYGHFDFVAASHYMDMTRNLNLAVSVDSMCSAEGCWYCKNRCHSCFQNGSVGHTSKMINGSLRFHCSARCCQMHTENIADSTVVDITVGKDDIRSSGGTYLLLSTTVILHTHRSKNTVYSTQLCVSYNNRNIPSGVLYACCQSCTTQDHIIPLLIFVDHELSPVKGVWPGLPSDAIKSWRERAILKRVIQPCLDSLECSYLPRFLKMKFPSTEFQFTSPDGRIYSLGADGDKDYTTGEGQQLDSMSSPQECIRSLQ